MLAGYLLLAPSIFFLGPLALLLLVSRPSSRREWIWLVISLLGVAASVQGGHGLFEQTVRGYGAFFAGIFVIAALIGVRSLVNRALLGVTVATAAIAVWYFRLHLRFVDFRADVSTATWDAYRRIYPELPAVAPTTGNDAVGSTSVSEFARNLADGLASASKLTPGFLTLLILLGAWLAWGWYHRVSRRPIGPPAKPFVDFRFNDQLIWLLLLASAVGLRAPDGDLSTFSANLFVVLAGLYAARGLAVAQCALRRVSALFALVLYLLAFPVLPFAMFAIGVADTWLDLRRRIAPIQGATP